MGREEVAEGDLSLKSRRNQEANMSKSDRRKWRRVDFNDLPSEGKILFIFFSPFGSGPGRIRSATVLERHSSTGFSR